AWLASMDRVATGSPAAQEAEHCLFKSSREGCGQHHGTRIILTAHLRTPPHLCSAPVCASRSRCARKNAHIRLDASILLLVCPTNHSGSGWPPGQVWPPPLMV